MTDNKYYCQISFKFTLLIALFFFLLPFSAGAIGQLTEPIVIENGLRGQEFEQTLSLLNTEDLAIQADLLAEGDIADWVKFYNKYDDSSDADFSSIRLEPKARKAVLAIITIPEDTANGEYTGLISVLQNPADNDASTSEETYALLKQKVSRQVTINVTDEEMIDFTTSFIPVSYSVGQGDQFKFKIIYDNKGNVAIKPQVQVRLSQADKTIYNAILPYPDDEPAVKPLKSHELPVMEVPVTGAEFGKVKVKVTTTYNNDIIETSDFRFDYNEKVEAPVENTENNNKEIGQGTIYALGGILLVLLIGAIVFMLKGKNKK